MEPLIRVMIVDDSLVVRRLVEDSLHEVPGVAVVGTAANGKIALAKLDELQPDVVTLDVEMPELDGLATLKRLKQQRPKTHVIMFSSLTGPSAASTLEALASGASDFVQKPTGTGGMNATRERIRGELVPKIRALCAPGAGGAPGAGPGLRPLLGAPARVMSGLIPRSVTTPMPIIRARSGLIPRSVTMPLPIMAGAAVPGGMVVIGVSTGGPAALHALLSDLPANLGAPVLIVQHMPASFSGLLAKRLAGVARVPVLEAVHGTVIAPGKVWLAPGDHHLAIARRGAQLVLEITQGPPEHSCRPSVDVLFRSAAAEVGARCVAVVLTGMGQDGLDGCKQIHAAGGTVLVQDAASSVVWGMPGAVARAGLADRVVPLAEMPAAITHAVSILQGISPGATTGGLRARP